MKNESIKKRDPKELWASALNKLQPAIHADGFSPIDTVRVKVATRDQYLQELGQDKHIIDSDSYSILKMTPEQLKERQLSYKEGKLVTHGMVADTKGMFSKDKGNLQAFVMTKTGELYMDTHKGFYENEANLVHGSFLSDRPLEMAGMISISNGQITMVSNDSGHYQPEKLDMYRGIKHLQNSMPGIFAQDCMIDLRGVAPQRMSDFITAMEKIEKNGKPRHQNLRNERIQESAEYKTKLQDAILIHDIKHKKDIKIIEARLDKIGDINRLISNNGILHHACQAKNKDVIKVFVTKGADLNIQDVNGRTPLHYTILKNDLESTKLLITKGAKINIRDVKGKSPLHYAVEENQPELVRLLIEKADLNIQDLNIQDVTGRAPLHYAIKDNNEELINLLITKGAKLDIIDKADKTPLDYAIEKNNQSLIKLLINKGANPNVQNKDKKTALHRSVNAKDQELTKLLIENKANLDIQDNSGNTGLHYAVKNNDKDLTKLLIGNKANLDIQDNLGNTILHYAVNAKDQELTKLLIGNKANLDIQDNLGNTVLYYAAKNKDKDLLQLLIKAGADPNIKNKDNRSPAEIAPGLCDKRAIKSLFKEVIMNNDIKSIDNMLKNNSELKDSKTLLAFAKDNNKVEVVEYLIKKGFRTRVDIIVGKMVSVFQATKPQVTTTVTTSAKNMHNRSARML